MPAGSFDAETIKRLVPVQPVGTPQEVAALAAFLASADVGHITGHVISIDDGLI